jgi:hypothetical protein
MRIELISISTPTHPLARPSVSDQTSRRRELVLRLVGRRIKGSSPYRGRQVRFDGVQGLVERQRRDSAQRRYGAPRGHRSLPHVRGINGTASRVEGWSRRHWRQENHGARREEARMES